MTKDYSPYPEPEWRKEIRKREQIIRELEDMVCDVNVEEIKAHDTDLSLRQWTLAWGNKMMMLLAELKGGDTE